jgi:hypothetical protein
MTPEAQAAKEKVDTRIVITHLQSKRGTHMTACGLPRYGYPWRSIKRVDCKNCLKLIGANAESAYFKPKEVKS